MPEDTKERPILEGKAAQTLVGYLFDPTNIIVQHVVFGSDVSKAVQDPALKCRHIPALRIFCDT
jgi:hypothetical protein